MESQSKRAIIATVACLLVLFGWTKLWEIWYPPAPLDTTATTAESASSQGGVDAAPATVAATSSPVASGGSKIASALFTATNDDSAKPVTLGDDRHDDKKVGFVNSYRLAATVTPRAGGVESIRLSQYRNHIPKNKRDPGHDPYDLARPLGEAGSETRYGSFDAMKILLVEDKQSVDLSGVNWSVTKQSDEKGESAVLQTTIKKTEQPILTLRKTYRLAKGSDHLELNVTVENLSLEPRRVVITQRGPIGFSNEDVQRESRRVASNLVSFEMDAKGNPKTDANGQPILTVSDGPHFMRPELLKAEDYSVEFRAVDKHLLWTALGNKYFACIVTWLPMEGSKLPYADYLAKVAGRIYLPDDTTITSDLTRICDLSFEQALAPASAIAPGKSVSLNCEVYCGAKDDALFAALPPKFKQRQYERVSDPDRTGCTFQAIPTLMLWLLNILYKVFRNYGLAIIGLVFIVRLILHPITKGGQVRMMRTQKRMAELKPKLEAIQEQHKGDKQKLNEETMKLYREQGVSPASTMLGCLPMMLQLPIWAGLWVSLNTNVHLRHQPFFWWIKDLSIPDGLYTPDTPWHLDIPLLSFMTGTIHAFNLLPIIMTITMYAQQKFMQKITKPSKPAAPKLDAEGRPIPDQMEQQQKMMNFMMIFFGAMFYNMPAGLNIYILCSNLLGMAEQYRIKMHIKEKDERGDFNTGGPMAKGPPRGPSWFERLQKRAEALGQAKASGELHKARKQKKQPRF